jgi:zinc transporter ZupT
MATSCRMAVGFHALSTVTSPLRSAPGTPWAAAAASAMLSISARLGTLLAPFTLDGGATGRGMAAGCGVIAVAMPPPVSHPHSTRSHPRSPIGYDGSTRR